MRFLHLADLHLGKRVNEFSMIEDQKYVLKQVLNIVEEYNVQSVLMAGDIYDKSVPSAEAVLLLNDFLTELSKREIITFVISGNHDSAERIGFGSDIMSLAGIYMAKPYDGKVEQIVMKDEYGELCVYMLPFIKPAIVKHAHKEDEITTYDDAMSVVMKNIDLDKRKRNILIAHQYVSGADRCDSENISIGGIDEVSAGHFKDFDYVALGHLHGPQHVCSENIRYAGTLLKYSFSEVHHHKNALIVDIGEEGVINFEKIDIKPLHDMRELKGTYNELTAKTFYQDMDVEDYFHITLTDEEDKVNALELLRTIYPNIMKLDYDNQRTRQNCEVMLAEKMEEKSPLNLFEEFYEMQSNVPMTNEQKAFIKEMVQKIWEVE
ncbi:MAG: exonuclease SbcCD subunit D [Eubacterium sp.]|nr:exonuclease SbcCD subunit D [Eubacterium sp.]